MCRSIWRVRSGALGGNKRRLEAAAAADGDSNVDAPAPAASSASHFDDPGVVAGYYRSAGPLQFLVVLNSGHLLPMDQPGRALDLVYRFTRGLSFADEALAAPWTEEEKDPMGGQGKKPMKEDPGVAAQRLRRNGFVGFLLGFVLICVAVVAGSVAYRGWQRKWGRKAGYEGVGSGEEEHGAWPPAAVGGGVGR